MKFWLRILLESGQIENQKGSLRLILSLILEKEDVGVSGLN
jgi:hypothetical protein